MESIRKGKCLDSSIFNIANQLPPLVLFEKGRPRLLFKLYSFMTRVDHHCLDYYLVKVIALNFDVASFMTFKPNGRDGAIATKARREKQKYFYSYAY